MSVDLLKEPQVLRSIPPVEPRSDCPVNPYAVVLRAPRDRSDVFMVRVMAKHFCQAEAYKRHPDNAEERARYAQVKAVDMVRQMLREGFLVAAIYPNRDIAETKVASIKEQERAYGGFLPAHIRRMPL